MSSEIVLDKVAVGVGAGFSTAGAASVERERDGKGKQEGSRAVSRPERGQPTGTRLQEPQVDLAVQTLSCCVEDVPGRGRQNTCPF